MSSRHRELPAYKMMYLEQEPIDSRICSDECLVCKPENNNVIKVEVKSVSLLWSCEVEVV
jgi:hypothetical protein